MKQGRTAPHPEHSMAATSLEALGAARTVALTTFRRDGRAVTTPVWSALVEGRLYVGTPGGTGKVKRLRNNPAVRMAPCNTSGSRILGDWREGRARRVEDHAVGQAYLVALRRKYGWQYTLIMFLYRLRGLLRDRALYEIELTPSA
jgi:uncharacterized protein